MQRRQLVVGDAPAGGGRILPFTPPFSMKVLGHQVAIIGGRVYCEACRSVGVIAKAGGSRRMGYITEVALEGDLCVCQCPQPQPLVSTLQGISSVDDTDHGAALGIPVWEPGSGRHLVASKIVDEQVQHPAEAQQTEDICPNMTNAEFGKLMLELRDEARMLVGGRLEELDRWNATAHARILEWFGDPGPTGRTDHLNSLRDHLRIGLESCDRVLHGLTEDNFVRWSPNAHRHLSCKNIPIQPGLAAQVCKPDTQTHTIAIGLDFCTLRRTTQIHGSHEIRDGDSQIMTIIHEITHFDDVFSSTDEWPGNERARNQVALTKDFPVARFNADSLAGYIAATQRAR